MMEEGGSPFLHHMSLLKGRHTNFMSRLNNFRSIVDTDWNNVRRWLNHYVERRWDDFDRTAELIYQEKWVPPKKQWQRHDVIHRSLDMMTAPLWVDDHYPKMKEAWLGGWSIGPDIPKERLPQVVEFAKRMEGNGEIARLQRDIFHCLELYINNKSSILPALAIAMYPDGIDDAVEQLHIFRDDFPVLRDLYITTFETCHRGILFALAPVNAVRRGDVEDFGDGTVGFERFQRKVNAQKAEFLKNIPEWQTRWGLIFDRQLRNKIGHHGVRHDLPSGALVFEDGSRIPYTMFVLATFKVLGGILIIANVLKTLAIADLMCSEG